MTSAPSTPDDRVPLGRFVLPRAVAMLAVLGLSMTGEHMAKPLWVAISAWIVVFAVVSSLTVVAARGRLRPTNLLSGDIAIASALSWTDGPLTIAAMTVAVVSAALWAYLHPSRLGLVPLMATVANVGFLAATGRVEARPADWLLAITLGAALVYVLALRSLYLLITRAEREKAIAAIEQLDHAASHDPLTGLPNRRELLRSLDEATRRNGSADGDVALMLVDIERFAVVNATLGYQTGDRVLVALGHRLSDLMRPGADAFRLDGDTFAVCAEVRNERDALALGAQLADELRRPMCIDETPLAVGVAIGIAIAPDTDSDPELLLRQANIATRSASGRREPVMRFSPEHDLTSTESLVLAAELPAAIRAGELEVSYQPQLDLATLTICGVEALVRWNHPTLGRVEPSRFVDLASLGGYLDELTIGVLSDALSDLRSWHEQGFPIDVSVNIGAMSLRDPTFADTVGRLLRAAGVDGRHLRLELTEAELIVDAEAAKETVAAVGEHGVRVSVDDFGTGYSSLAHLSDLHVGEIKIDRRFVVGMQTSEDDAVITRSIVDLAHRLGAFVTAEGVENDQLLDRLRMIDCDRAQGYLIGRPSPAPEIVPLMRRARRERLAVRNDAPIR